MRPDHNVFLILGAAGSALAALLHVGCIIFGAPWYRFFGAGEAMARLAESGSPIPTRVTSGIVLVLMIWTYCALAGAGLLAQPPLLRILLSGITAIYLIRAVMFVPMMKNMPGNSLTFWLWSSAICLALGVTHLIGTRQAWAHL